MRMFRILRITTFTMLVLCSIFLAVLWGSSYVPWVPCNRISNPVLNLATTDRNVHISVNPSKFTQLLIYAWYGNASVSVIRWIDSSAPVNEISWQGGPFAVRKTQIPTSVSSDIEDVPYVDGTEKGRLFPSRNRTPIWYRFDCPIWIMFVTVAIAPSIALVRFALRRRRSRRPEPTCKKCGYDLTGNISGICPECGQAISVLRSDNLDRPDA